MKKKLFSILGAGILCCTVLATGLGIAGCGKGNDPAPNVNVKQTFAFAAASASSLLSSQGGISTMAVTPEEENLFKSYMEIFEGVLGTGGLFNVTDEAYSNVAYPNFDRQMTILMKDLSGAETTVNLIYKETPKNEEDDDKDIDEVESLLTGVLISGTDTFDIEGEKEVEQDELEIKLTATKDGDIANRIEFKQEIESDGQEYKYTTYSNNAVVSSTSLEIEQENNETEIELEITKNGETNYYELDKETENGTEYIKIEHLAGQNSLTVVKTIRVNISTLENGEKVYEFLDLNRA